MVAQDSSSDYCQLVSQCNLNYVSIQYMLQLLVAAMLIAVHFLPSMAKDIDRAKLIIILMSALVGYIILLLAVYNIYPIRYHKSKSFNLMYCYILWSIV